MYVANRYPIPKILARFCLVSALLWASFTLWLAVIPNKKVASGQTASISTLSQNINIQITIKAGNQLTQTLKSLTTSPEQLRSWKKRLPADGLLHAGAALILWLLFYASQLSWWFSSALTALHSLMIEGLQYFVPYRTSSWKDISFALLAVVLMILLRYGILGIRSLYRSR